MCHLKLTERPYDAVKSDELIALANEIKSASEKRTTRWWPPFPVLGNRFAALSRDVVRGKNLNREKSYQAVRVDSAFQEAKRAIQQETVDYAKRIAQKAHETRTFTYWDWRDLEAQFHWLDRVIKELEKLSELGIEFDPELTHEYTKARDAFKTIATPPNRLVDTCASVKESVAKTAKNSFRTLADTFYKCRNAAVEGGSRLAGRCSREKRNRMQLQFREKLKVSLRKTEQSLSAVASNSAPYLNQRNLKWIAGALSPFALLAFLQSIPRNQEQWAEFFSPGMEFIKETKEPLLFGCNLRAIGLITILAGSILTLAFCKKPL